jgi:hypothetical protein
MSAKQSLREEVRRWQALAHQSDRGRQEATALIAAILVKFGGSLTLTKLDAAPITNQFAVERNIDPVSGAVTLKIRVYPQQAPTSS